MFKKIQRILANKRILKHYENLARKPRIKTLNNSKSVGILWNPADEGSLETYELFRKLLKDKGIKSTGLAYVENQRQIDSLSLRTHSGYLHRQSIKWTGRPNSGDAFEFIWEPFDILIDLSVSKIVALQYILVHSHAIFKVGWQGREANYYDLSIDVSENPQCSFLMEQIVFYLENIHEKGG